MVRSASLYLIAASIIHLVFASDTVDAALSHSAKVYTWPLDAASPSPYLDIHYNPSTHQTTISKSHSPSRGAADDGSRRSGSSNLLRFGLWNPTTQAWRGMVTAAPALEEGCTRTVSLHLDAQGNAVHLGLSASKLGERRVSSRAGAEGHDSRVRVQLVRASPGPRPVLNEPVVLDAQGKMPEKEVEKSFLQR